MYNPLSFPLRTSEKVDRSTQNPDIERSTWSKKRTALAGLGFVLIAAGVTMTCLTGLSHAVVHLPYSYSWLALAGVGLIPIAYPIGKSLLEKRQIQLEKECINALQDFLECKDVNMPSSKKKIAQQVRGLIEWSRTAQPERFPKGSHRDVQSILEPEPPETDALTGQLKTLADELIALKQKAAHTLAVQQGLLIDVRVTARKI